MLYLGIDLHRKQITVSLRKEDGDLGLWHQVSTQWPKLEEFREQLREFAAGDEKYADFRRAFTLLNSTRIEWENVPDSPGLTASR